MNPLQQFKDRKSTKAKVNGIDIYIKSLSVGQVEEIQELYKDTGEEGEVSGNEFDALRTIISMGIEGCEEITLDEIKEIPLIDIRAMVDAVMKAAGLVEKK